VGQPPGDIETESEVSLGFILTRDAKLDGDAIVDAAGKLGLTLEPMEGGDDTPLGFKLDDLTFFVMAIEAPHPDAPKMFTNPIFSPSEEDVAAAKAHLIVTAMGLDGDLRAKDALMAKLLVASAAGSSAVGVMLGHGILFYKTELFTAVVEGTEAGALPVEVCVDFTMAPEPGERMSFLTHGLQRYGREEFYVTAPQSGQGAIEFLMSLVRWMIVDPDKHLPTGETVGRGGEEKIEVQRVPNPTGTGPEVVRLDLS